MKRGDASLFSWGCRFWAPSVLALLLSGANFAAADSPTSDRADAADSPPTERADAVHGRVLFERVWTAGEGTPQDNDGLGPKFNERSCAACHSQGGLGGGGANRNNVDLLSVVVPEKLQFKVGKNGFDRDAQGRPVGSPSPSLLAFTRSVTQIDAGLSGGTMVLHSYGTDLGYATTRTRLLGKPTKSTPAGSLGIRIDPPQLLTLRPAADTSAIRHGDVELRLSHRNSTALFGAGLIDLISNADRRAIAEEQAAAGSKVSGRMLGRYGWRGQTDALDAFVAGACSVEIGLSTTQTPPSAEELRNLTQVGLERNSKIVPNEPDINPAQLRDLVEFVYALPAPQRRAAKDEEEAAKILHGEKVFTVIGCSDCHRQRIGQVAGLYSDLLMHDMGPRLADNAAPAAFSLPPPGLHPSTVRSSSYNGSVISLGEIVGVRAQEWRTPPLWGLADSAPYMHDGRALTVEEAILCHDGEASEIIDAYWKLPQNSRADLLTFLSTLVAPAQGR